MTEYIFVSLNKNRTGNAVRYNFPFIRCKKDRQVFLQKEKKKGQLQNPHNCTHAG